MKDPKVGDRIRVLTSFWICSRCGSRDLSATGYMDDPAFPPEKRGKTFANEHTRPDGHPCPGGWIVPPDSHPQQRERTGTVVGLAPLTRGGTQWVKIRFDDYEDRTGCTMWFNDGQPIFVASWESCYLSPAGKPIDAPSWETGQEKPL